MRPKDRSHLKGALLFKSGLTRELYDSFLRSYELDRSELKSPPYVYVDLETGAIKLLTNLMKSSGADSQISAVSIAIGGSVEVLSTEG